MQLVWFDETVLLGGRFRGPSQRACSLYLTHTTSCCSLSLAGYLKLTHMPARTLQIPLHSIVRETSDCGAPVVHSEPDSAPAQAYKSVAERVWQQLQAKGREQQAPKIIVE